ncbi:MAG: GntR family transcriptional regulator [Desulfobacula sp.]|jgi:DNA-binding GntR family transcriptional regulator|uniref:GntR family transcriptional regulator n=1 Tax=Desulfobacula sp. TaxID=2593537 RepID=UPI001D9E1C82|nr:GntR family transcriptional regulator [Desulfobacula sp.]MBT3486670.1 GntR family transcriptional regulator [Desulfobacula sp.]MBT3804886.1 GntR family transcriptional regulator [Desulfobacula sp.]MBT4026663.1 GntR family transcriptional regulator [Desulfobacula sp.]MBT4200487.1 GntR family transcriptional regulator [Desulfobacula sp.]
MKLDNNFKERKSLGQDVFDYLKKSIIDQSIEPGARLVESKISDMLGISRTPLREALHKLEREDWIEKIPSGGFQVVTLTKDDIEQTFGIRSVLEAYAARLAAENHETLDLIPLEKKIMEFKICLEKKDHDKLQKINTQFHDLLYALSKSPKLIKMINQLRAQISRFRQMILKQSEYAHKSNEDHIKMLEAIKNRDGDAVEKLVKAHIIKGKIAVLTQLKQEEEKKKSA